MVTRRQLAMCYCGLGLIGLTLCFRSLLAKHFRLLGLTLYYLFNWVLVI